MIDFLATFAGSVSKATPDPPPDCDHELLFLSRCIELLLKEGVTCTSQSFNRVISKLQLAYFISPGYSWFLYCAQKIESIITRQAFTK